MLILCLFEDVVKGQSQVDKLSYFTKLANIADRLQDVQTTKLNDWPRVRETLKAMRKKFQRESSHEIFEDFVAQSRLQWHVV